MRSICAVHHKILTVYLDFVLKITNNMTMPSLHDCKYVCYNPQHTRWLGISVNMCHLLE